MSQITRCLRCERRLLPDAEWICGDVFEVLPLLPPFDTFIANPPFGRIASASGRGRFASVAHFAVLELMLTHCWNGGITIIPDADHSREDSDRRPNSNYLKFIAAYPQAKITPGPFDPACYQFQAANIRCQICSLDIDEPPELPSDQSHPSDRSDPSDSPVFAQAALL